MKYAKTGHVCENTMDMAREATAKMANPAKTPLALFEHDQIAQSIKGWTR